MPPTRGFVYVATGPRYLAEAIQAVQSLRRHNPDTRVCLVADALPPNGLFDDVIRLENPTYSFADKLAMDRAPYDQVIYLDTDTLILADIRDLFDLLDHHDVAAKHEVYPGWDYDALGVPRCFPEFNLGMIAFRRSAAALSFFANWHQTYNRLRAQSERFVTDQPSFRIALYHSTARHCTIPTEYHLQADFGGFMYWEVKVIHSHGPQERIADEVNRILGPRTYDPVVGTIPAGYRGRRALLTTWLWLNVRLLRALVRAVLTGRPT